MSGVVTAAAPTVQEQQCHSGGWQRAVSEVQGLARLVLWKAPPDGTWQRGALLILHGGGGTHTNFCVANVTLIEPQVRFANQALAAGFAVFLLDSSDQVHDANGRLCGKVWDDAVNARSNLDLPFLEDVLTRLIPSKRPSTASQSMFMTGLSSGGYMSLRAATRLGHLITASALVSSGDPYGWARDCTPRGGDRSNVFGIAYDVESGRPISEESACGSPSRVHERSWDTSPGNQRPAIRQFYHRADGIHDVSCAQKAGLQLIANGYSPLAPFVLDADSRNATWHYWLDDYNVPILDYFANYSR